MDYRAWVRDPANFPGKYGELFMRFVAARQGLHNVTDATVVWYVSSWKVYREHVAQATTERDLRQHLYDGITAFGQTGVRPVTVNTATRCMQAFLNWLLEIEHIERPIKLPKLKVEERVLRVLSMEQIANLYHYVPKNMCQRRIHAITVLLLDTGIRTSEMLNLSPQEVDFKTRTLRVMGKGRKERGGYPLDSGDPYRLWFGPPGCWVDDPVIRDRINCHGLLGEAEEELAATLRSPPVESEGELIQVVVEVLLADGSLVGAQ